MKIFSKKTISKSLILFTPLICAPIITSVSCSNSIESKLESLLSNHDIVDVQIDFNQFLINLNKNPEDITIKDLFISNFETVKIVENEDLINWNKNLSLSDEKLFKIKPEIRGITFPTKHPSETNLNSISIFIDISAGHIEKKIIEKKLDLSKINSSLSLNNYFDWRQNLELDMAGPEKNNLFRILKTNILGSLLLNINTSGVNLNDISELERIFNIKLISNSDNNNSNIFQNDLRCSFDSKNEGWIYLNIYNSIEPIQNNELIKNSIALVISFEENLFSNIGNIRINRR